VNCLPTVILSIATAFAIVAVFVWATVAHSATGRCEGSSLHYKFQESLLSPRPQAVMPPRWLREDGAEG